MKTTTFRETPLENRIETVRSTPSKTLYDLSTVMTQFRQFFHGGYKQQPFDGRNASDPSRFIQSLRTRLVVLDNALSVGHNMGNIPVHIQPVFLAYEMVGWSSCYDFEDLFMAEWDKQVAALTSQPSLNQMIKNVSDCLAENKNLEVSHAVTILIWTMIEFPHLIWDSLRTFADFVFHHGHSAKELPFVTAKNLIDFRKIHNSVASLQGMNLWNTLLCGQFAERLSTLRVAPDGTIVDLEKMVNVLISNSTYFKCHPKLMSIYSHYEDEFDANEVLRILTGGDDEISTRNIHRMYQEYPQLSTNLLEQVEAIKQAEDLPFVVADDEMQGWTKRNPNQTFDINWTDKP